MATWQATDLSVSPPSYQMADTDRRTFTFTAPADWPVDVTGAEIWFARIDPGPYEFVEGVASQAGEIDGKTVTVLVDMRDHTNRDVTYQLDVTLVGADGNTETMTLVIPCVA